MNLLLDDTGVIIFTSCRLGWLGWFYSSLHMATRLKPPTFWSISCSLRFLLEFLTQPFQPSTIRSLWRCYRISRNLSSAKARFSSLWFGLHYWCSIFLGFSVSNQANQIIFFLNGASCPPVCANEKEEWIFAELMLGQPKMWWRNSISLSCVAGCEGFLAAHLSQHVQYF